MTTSASPLNATEARPLSEGEGHLGGGDFPTITDHGSGSGNHCRPVETTHTGIVYVTTGEALIRYQKKGHGGDKVGFQFIQKIRRQDILGQP